MWDFENRYSKERDIHYSRVIASWLNAGGSRERRLRKKDTLFWKWLMELGFSEEEANEIYEMYRCGKLEYEDSAKAFLAKNK